MEAGIYFEIYSEDWVGLKHSWFGSPIHGVPEGTIQEWEELFSHMEEGISYNVSSRLEWDGSSIFSPRNTDPENGRELFRMSPDEGGLKNLFYETLGYQKGFRDPCVECIKS